MRPAREMLRMFIAPIDNPADTAGDHLLPQVLLMPRTLEMLLPFTAPSVASPAILTKLDLATLARFHGWGKMATDVGVGFTTVCWFDVAFIALGFA